MGYVRPPPLSLLVLQTDRVIVNVAALESEMEREIPKGLLFIHSFPFSLRWGWGGGVGQRLLRGSPPVTEVNAECVILC